MRRWVCVACLTRFQASINWCYCLALTNSCAWISFSFYFMYFSMFYLICRMSVCQVCAVDAWGNMAFPSERLVYSVQLQSDAVLNSPVAFPFKHTGVATVAGVVIKAPKTGVQSHQSQLAMSVRCEATTDAARAALKCVQRSDGMVCNFGIQLNNTPDRWPETTRSVITLFLKCAATFSFSKLWQVAALMELIVCRPWVAIWPQLWA